MRLIDADALLEALQKQCTSLDIPYKVFSIINNAPTVQREGWVSLSYDEIESLYDGGSWHEFAEAISEKLRELNEVK